MSETKITGKRKSESIELPRVHPLLRRKDLTISVRLRNRDIDYDFTIEEALEILNKKRLQVSYLLSNFLSNSCIIHGPEMHNALKITETPDCFLDHAINSVVKFQNTNNFIDDIKSWVSRSLPKFNQLLDIDISGTVAVYDEYVKRTKLATVEDKTKEKYMKEVEKIFNGHIGATADNSFPGIGLTYRFDNFQKYLFNEALTGLFELNYHYSIFLNYDINKSEFTWPVLIQHGVPVSYIVQSLLYLKHENPYDNSTPLRYENEDLCISFLNLHNTHWSRVSSMIANMYIDFKVDTIFECLLSFFEVDYSLLR